MKAARTVMRAGLLALLPLIAGLPALAGCSSYPEIIELEIRSEIRHLKPWVPPAERLKVAVLPFTDLRQDLSRLGSLTRFEDPQAAFQVVGDDLGEMIAQALIEYLKGRQGWQVWIVKQGVRPPEGGPDLTLSGQVLVCSANADSWPAGTRIFVNAAIAVQVLNQRDGSTVRMTVDGHESQWVFSFSPPDIEQMLRRTVHTSFEKLIAATEVEGGILRLKEPEGTVPGRGDGPGTGSPEP